ncbi:MAG: hypothetical protein WAM28_00170 [Chlamydiales bacterium]
MSSWVIAISCAVVALMFLLLVVFLIITLVSVCRTLKTTQSICADIESKIHAFDPLFHVVSGVGQAVEKRACNVQQLAEDVDKSCARDKSQKTEGILNTALEVVEWGLIGVSLLKRIKDRR